MLKKTLGSLLLLLSLAACAQPQNPSAQFFENMSLYCGKAFQGHLVSHDEGDADFAEAEIIMHIRDCSADEIRIPLHVGENRSRTWVISKTAHGLRLKHDHRHQDGSEDAVTQYGGDSSATRSAHRQEFPADEFSKIMFVREGLDVSVENIWAIEVTPDLRFAYELRRPNRYFRLEFNLLEPIPLPPDAWGAD